MSTPLSLMTNEELIHYVRDVHTCLDPLEKEVMLELANRLEESDDKSSTKD